MPWMTCSARCLLVMLLVLVSACCGGTRPQPVRPQPTAVERAPCLRHQAPPPGRAWIEAIYSDPARTDLEALLWQRIETLEQYAARAWAACGARSP